MPALSLKHKVAPVIKDKAVRRVARRPSVRASASGAKRHELLSGQVVDLRELDAREQEFLRDLVS